MDLEVARKALSRKSAFSSKRVAFFVVAGLFLVAGIVLRSGHYFTRPEVEQNAPVAVTSSPAPAAATSTAEPTEPVTQPPSPPATATVPQPPSPSAATTVPQPSAMTESLPQPSTPSPEAATPPNEQKEPTDEAIEEPHQADEAVDRAEPEFPGSGMILVSRQPIGVLASPSSSAPVLYGFPAGRPFRVIGRSAGFAHIQDLKSSASGWIDEAALAPSGPVGSAPSQPKPYSVSRIPPNSWAGPTPKVTKNDSAVTADSRAATSRKRPGLFGRGGLFGGIFSNGN